MLRVAQKVSRQLPIGLVNKIGTTNSRFFSITPLLALIQAVEKKDIATIHAISKSSPQLIVQQTNNDNTALHEAAKRGDVMMIRLLSQAFSTHFNVNHKCHCRYARTPIHYAVEEGHLDATNALLDLGADPNIVDKLGRTTLDIALEKKNDQLAFAIFQRGGRANKMQEAALVLPLRISANRYTSQILKQIQPDPQGFQKLLCEVKAPEMKRN